MCSFFFRFAIYLNRTFFVFLSQHGNFFIGCCRQFIKIQNFVMREARPAHKVQDPLLPPNESVAFFILNDQNRNAIDSKNFKNEPVNPGGKAFIQFEPVNV